MIYPEVIYFFSKNKAIFQRTAEKLYIKIIDLRGLMKIQNFYIRSFIIWLLIIFAESIHGTLRTILLEPRIGGFRARQISVFTGALIILTITFFFIRWISAREVSQFIKIGVFWVISTIAFEIILGRFILDASWERIFSDYKIWEGGLMPIGLLCLIFTPLITAKMRKII